MLNGATLSIIFTQLRARTRAHARETKKGTPYPILSDILSKRNSQRPFSRYMQGMESIAVSLTNWLTKRLLKTCRICCQNLGITLGSRGFSWLVEVVANGCEEA